MPLSSEVARELAEYAERFPPAELTSPWVRPGGNPVTVRVYLVDHRSQRCMRGAFNSQVWRSELARPA